MTPRTEAGKRLLTTAGNPYLRKQMLAAIIAIEAEAAVSSSLDVLRELSEAATPGRWTDRPTSSSTYHRHVASVEADAEALGPLSSTGWIVGDFLEPYQRGVNGPPTRDRYEAGANARFAAAAVNYVRDALAHNADTDTGGEE